MSSSIIISVYYNGKQKDYEAVFTSCRSVYQFKVMINNNSINFEGGADGCFKVSSEESKRVTDVDASMLEALTQQLNQIFY